MFRVVKNVMFDLLRTSEVRSKLDFFLSWSWKTKSHRDYILVERKMKVQLNSVGVLCYWLILRNSFYKHITPTE